jgi:hypothetical protein
MMPVLHLLTKRSFPSYIGQEYIPEDADGVYKEHLELDGDEPQVDGGCNWPKLPSLLASHPNLLSCCIHALPK